jgi:hypothetical protein
MLVARYTRAVSHTFKNDEPASLEVSSAHLYVLDMILFTALWLEHRRVKKKETVSSVLLYCHRAILTYLLYKESAVVMAAIVT